MKNIFYKIYKYLLDKSYKTYYNNGNNKIYNKLINIYINMKKPIHIENSFDNLTEEEIIKGYNFMN